MPLPPSLRADTPAIAAARRETTPAGSDQVSLALARLGAVFPAFGPEHYPEWTRALSVLPADLLDRAISATIDHVPHAIPKPAEILGFVRDKLNDRCDRLNREIQVRLDALRGPSRRPPPTPDQIAHVDAIMAKYRADLPTIELPRVKPVFVVDEPDWGGLRPIGEVLPSRGKGE
jgi:hypothetical protein